MTTCQIVPGIILAVILFGGIFFIKPWEVPISKAIKIIRSIGVGILTEIFLLSSFMILGWAKTNDHCLTAIPDFGLGYLACFVFPLSIGASIGYYFGYKQFSWLHWVRKTIDRRK